MSTLWELLQKGKDDAVAIETLNRDPLTYQGLREQIVEGAKALHGAGVERENIVAIAVPDVEAATITLTASSFYTAAPFSPDCKEDEFKRYFDTLQPNVLVTTKESEAAISAADSLGIPIVYLVPERNKPAGCFRMETRDGMPIESARALPSPPSPDNIGMVLQTSGTTSEPKYSERTQEKLSASPETAARVTGITENDKCLNCSPLFHALGLRSGLIVPLAAGSSTFIVPPIAAIRDFEGLLTSTGFTWLNCTPTIFKSVREQAQKSETFSQSVEASDLRLIRPISGPLNQDVMRGYLETFPDVDIVSAYASTETGAITTHRMTPEEKTALVNRKDGYSFLGETLPWVETRILDHEGNDVPEGTPGELVIRSPYGFDQYGDADATETALMQDNWFRTGDCVVSEGGVLFLVSRVKEIIRVGEESVSPIEIESTLSEHPAVEAAIAFPVPDTKRGEAVGTLVVLKEGAAENIEEIQQIDKEIKKLEQEYLSPFKRPRVRIIADEVPTTGALDKVSRSVLADTLGLDESTQGLVVMSERIVPPATISKPKLQEDKKDKGIPAIG